LVEAGSDLFNSDSYAGSRARAKLLLTRQNSEQESRKAPGEQNCDTGFLKKSLPKAQAVMITTEDT